MFYINGKELFDEMHPFFVTHQVADVFDKLAAILQDGAYLREKELDQLCLHSAPPRISRCATHEIPEVRVKTRR
jgi:hypothetical protein